MIYNSNLHRSILDDRTPEAKLDNILFIMSKEYFGQRKAASMVGGLGRLLRLIEEGKIQADKPTNKQNGKWFCNASDVLKYAIIKHRKPYKRRNDEKGNNKRITA
jgi:hypothetical protein